MLFYRFLMVMVIFVSMVIFPGISHPCDGNPWKDAGYSLEEYDLRCPWGDAVVVSKDEMVISGLAGRKVDCVIWDQTNQRWKTTTYDWYSNEFVIIRYDPKEYNVYNGEGQLQHNLRGQVYVEKVDYNRRGE